MNWENPNVRGAIYEMMCFWLDKGIDGFRMDVINLLSKREDFSDGETPEKLDYIGNNPGIHTYLKEMHDKVLKLYDIFTVGEIPFVGPEDGVKYVGEARGELHTLFHFKLPIVCQSGIWNAFVRYKTSGIKGYGEEVGTRNF